MLRKAKLIAEPWDIGPGGYQLGNFPRGLGRMERPLPRRRAPLLARRRRHARRARHPPRRLARTFSRAPAPTKSVNFIVAHDGFTLADLVSYAHKHNEANGENNRDGTNENYSWNNGVEGPTDDPAINAARARDMRNLLALLFVARGAPMLAMGAEIGHSQRGNNNAYAQDNAISWLDWRTRRPALAAFVGRSPPSGRRIPRCPARRLADRQPVRRQRPARRRMARRRRRRWSRRQQWEAPYGDVLVGGVAPRPTGDGGSTASRSSSTAATSATLRSFPRRARGMRWRVLIDASAGEAADAPNGTSPTERRLRRRARR